jgi:hypothetical protein
MRLILVAVKAALFATVCLVSSASASKPERQNATDSEVYSRAIDSAKAARVAELESMLSDKAAIRSGSRKSVAQARAELKRLKSGNPLPRMWASSMMRIEVNAPTVGRVGMLTWGEVDEDKKSCKVERIVSATSVLARASWTKDMHIVAKSWSRPTTSGFAPSIKIGEDRFEGPLLLFINVTTSGLRSGQDVKTTDVFIVEGQREIDGESTFVLRRLIIDWKNMGKKH